LTAECFTCDPYWQIGSRLYRTGDLGRRRRDGEIEFLGRLDSQVKVRGFRIETGEVEAALSAHQSVRQAIVTAYEGGTGKTLVAYVVPAPANAVTAHDLSEFLKGRLPAYLVPGDYVFLERLPTTATGKVDKRALPPPSAAPSTRSKFVPPATPTEQAVAAIWSAVLARTDIGTQDNFFELGGHSLLASQIVSRIRKALGIDLHLKMLFGHPTIADLSAHIDDLESSSPPIDALTIGPVATDEACPLSISQRRLWFLEQLDPHNGAYHIGMSLKVVGDLSLSAMEQAQTEVVRRHEVLRSRIMAHDGSTYQAVQSVEPFVQVLDLTEVNGNPGRESLLGQTISLLHSRIFDLARAPLLRSWIVKTGDREHILAVTMHHLVSDGWSMNIFNDELSGLYESFERGDSSSLRELSLQYRDFAAWQNDWSKNGRFDSDLSYWKEQLGGELPLIDLPADHARPVSRSFAGATVSYSLDARSRADLKRIADAEGATLFMAYLGLLLSLLYRYTGQSDLIAGVPISGRNRPETEHLIGFFVNTLVLRSSVFGSLTSRQMIRRVRDRFLEAHAHQDLPFELLVEKLQPERDASRSPLFDLMFDLQAESGRTGKIRNLELAPFQHDSPTSKFDITISIADSGTDPRITIEYALSLFERSSIDRLAAHFNRIIEAGVRAPDVPVRALEFMQQSEIRQILEGFNDTRREFPEQSCIHDLFDSEAARLPDAIAAVSEDYNVTYGWLSRRANVLCRLLRSKGVSAESRVGICLPRSIDMIASLIAVVKAGGAYVPMDPSYPRARLDFMARDAEIELLITTSEMLGAVPTESQNVLVVDSVGYGDTGSASRPEGGPACPASLAYITYTSGTTGSPKGVAITHRGVVRLVKGADYAQLDDNQVVLQHSTVAFDAATFEIWGSLLNGARLILIPDDRLSLEELERAMDRHRVTTAWLTAGLFHLMADRLMGPLDSLGQLLAGGEALDVRQVNRFIDLMGSGRLINGYGPTEVTTFTCSHRFDKKIDPSRPAPIGRPISNTTVYVLDESLNPVPIAVKGQIHASGPGLARGYLNNPDLTGERFLPDPFSNAPGERMYVTGDAGSHRGGGHIEFTGRLDNQIKLRGYRIELGEIESVLASSPDVGTVVVVVRPDKTGERRLAAYAAAKPGATLTPKNLLEQAKAALPEFMVPSSFVIVDTIPLTRSGKVDREALPAPDLEALSSEGEFEEPRNAIEEGLALIWMRVLGRERIGIHDDFFSLGGHSLLATQVVSRIREAFEVDLPLRSLFENRDISRLGAVVEALLLDKLEGLTEEEAAGLLG
jgi:amino acid adenylation domain-containing protein